MLAPVSISIASLTISASTRRLPPRRIGVVNEHGNQTKVTAIILQVLIPYLRSKRSLVPWPFRIYPYKHHSQHSIPPCNPFRNDYDWKRLSRRVPSPPPCRQGSNSALDTHAAYPHHALTTTDVTGGLESIQQRTHRQQQKSPTKEPPPNQRATTSDLLDEMELIFKDYGRSIRQAIEPLAPMPASTSTNLQFYLLLTNPAPYT
jgi:hypothetical protein